MPAKKENKRFKDDQTAKRIHEHLSNKNDNITDEDISNVKTDIVEFESFALIYEEEEKLPGNRQSNKFVNEKKAGSKILVW